MNRLGVFVGENQNWTFFHDIFEDLDNHFDIEVFREKVFRTPLLHGRLNRWSHRHGIRAILRRSDVAYFEWTSQLLSTATLMEKYCPIVARMHSFELLEWASRVNWENVDRIIFVSEAMRQKFTSKYPKHADKAVVVYNGVPLDEFRPGDQGEGLRLGMLGHIVPIKRIYEVVLALPELIRRGVDAKLHLAGDPVTGPDNDRYFASCHRLVEKLNLNRRVTFHGHVNGPSEWLRGIDIFISNSFWEGQQVALVEALASGCYCLSHSWDGAEEVLPAAQLFTAETEMLKKIIEYDRLKAQEKLDRRQSMRAIACEKFDQRRQLAEIRQIVLSTLELKG